MEEFDELDDLEYGAQHFDYDPEEPYGYEDLDEGDFELADEFDDGEWEPSVQDSLDLERAYRALAEHRPDLLHPSVFGEPAPSELSPYDMTQSAAGMALRVMDARDQILSSVSDFGSEARSAAMSVLSETPPEALMNPMAVDLIANFAIGEAVRQGRMGSVSAPFGASGAISSGSGGMGGLASFESVFGAGQLTDSERAELRSAGF